MLHTLRLSHFRCYSSLRWEIPAEGAVLVGQNAQGKTSLIEAICVALSLHSPRTKRFDKLCEHGANEFGISLDTDEGSRRLAWKDRKLTMVVRGTPCRDFSDYLRDSSPIAWLSNRDIALVTGSAEERRHYLDFLGSQWHPLYRDSLQSYRKALKCRNALLRNPRHTAASLEPYNELLVRHGSLLIELRKQLLRLLQPHVAHNHLQISGKEETVSLLYAPSVSGDLREALGHVYKTDIRSGCTTIGPHRDDFLLNLRGVNAAEFASEGQQRTLSTALQLSQSSLLQEETGRFPILLIDDIFGELDTTRRQALLATLPTTAQVFITTTHLDWLRGSDLPLPIRNIEKAAIA